MCSENNLVARKMLTEVHVLSLIEEVKARPVLHDWKFANLNNFSVRNQAWQEVSEILGVDEDECRRKWKNLRDTYRAEVRREKRRMELHRASGDTDKSINLQSKWIYYSHLRFLEGCGRNDTTHTGKSEDETEGGDEGEYSNNSNNSIEAAQPLHEPDSQNFSDVKVEPHHSTVAGDVHGDEDGTLFEEFQSVVCDDNEDENDKLFAEFQSIATPQAARRLSNSISMSNALEDKLTDEDALPEPDCKCMKRDDQVHFLENLEREEQQLMQSTRLDISRDNSGHDFADSDYNFLMSFLPHMKRMCNLQNLQFRAKMSELLLNIMTPQTTNITPIAEQHGSVIQRSQQQQQQTQNGQRFQRQPTMSALAGGSRTMASEILGSTISSSNNDPGTTSSSGNNNIWN